MDAWIGHMRWALNPSFFAWRPDALLAAFQDAKSFSTFIGLAGLFIYQSKVRVGFIAWFWKTGEISDQVQPQVSHHRVLLWGTDRPDSRDFLSRLFLFIAWARASKSEPSLLHPFIAINRLFELINQDGGELRWFILVCRVCRCPRSFLRDQGRKRRESDFGECRLLSGHRLLSLCSIETLFLFF